VCTDLASDINTVQADKIVLNREDINLLKTIWQLERTYEPKI
jgi:hypothetical protein